MYRAHDKGTVEEIFGLKCNIPPSGYVFNVMTGQLERRGVYARSSRKSDQYWEPTKLPENYYRLREKEINMQVENKDYFDPALEAFRTQEWDRRLNGFWFYNNGVPTYVTGLHYFYMCYWSIDIGLPKFREPDRRYFYFLQYCIEDPECFGMVEISKRRQGKTFRGGVFLYEHASRTKNSRSGIQSKTGSDAKEVFRKAIIQPFKKLPDFFVPVYDQSKGLTPTSELRFYQTTVKGKKAASIKDDDELESMIDWKTSEAISYDGQKLQRYLGDEVGKCFGKGTLIRMYDGTLKAVEDIVDGDFVMGDDSTPRRVYGVTSGSEEMFLVVPNKGEGFVCNRSHILSLKWARREREFNGAKYGDVINISVQDYINLPSSVKKHLMLYRTGYDLPGVDHEFDPYIIGCWLGDGNSRDSKITTTDLEVLKEWYDLANSIGCKICIAHDKISYKISSGTSSKGSNKFLTFLQKKNLIKNKHIPDEYIFDSIENRLKLLAGIIDTDGYLCTKNGLPKYFEITQKRKELSYQIKELACSVGFYASIVQKKASMKRMDGTMYYCDVYRVCIYGDLFKVPTKVPHKKAENVKFHNNRKSPDRTGFSVCSVGSGDYYGFAVDGNHLFLLSDGTVVHNTAEINVWERYLVTRYCHLDDEGNIIGKSLLTTTVEDMEQGGEAFKKIWDNSDHTNKKGKRTPSGLYRYFCPADHTRYYDKYGLADREKALNEILEERKLLQNDSRALSAVIRKEPLSWEEAFRIDGSKCLFDAMKLNERLDRLSWKDNLSTKGNFVWVGAERDGRVEFEESPNGRWRVAKLFSDPAESNKILRRGDLFYPNNPGFVMGVDPVDHNQTQDGRRSDGAGIVLQKYNAAREDDIYNYAFVALYVHRPDNVSVFYEDMIKMCVYYGCSVLFENNKVGMMHYFNDRGYGPFLMWLPERNQPGVAASPKTHQHIAELTESYISEHSDKVYFKQLIQDWLEFDLSATTKFDAAMAAGYALIADQVKVARKDMSKVMDVKELFRSHKVQSR